MSTIDNPAAYAAAFLPKTFGICARFTVHTKVCQLSNSVLEKLENRPLISSK